jgi:hypothetical protein
MPRLVSAGDEGVFVAVAGERLAPPGCYLAAGTWPPTWRMR